MEFDGLPVFNAGYGGPALQDVNTSTGELSWWSPALNTHVVETGSTTTTLPFVNFSFYPPNGTGPNDASGFQTAVFRGILDVPTAEQIGFGAGVDDDLFVYVDGTNIIDMGGLSGYRTDDVSVELSPGRHTIEAFYADRARSGAVLYFDVKTPNVTVSPVPEPATIGVLAVGLLGLAVSRRR